MTFGITTIDNETAAVMKVEAALNLLTEAYGEWPEPVILRCRVLVEDELNQLYDMRWTREAFDDGFSTEG